MNEQKWRIYASNKIGLVYHVRKPRCVPIIKEMPSCLFHRECVAFLSLERAFAHIKDYEENP